MTTILLNLMVRTQCSSYLTYSQNLYNCSSSSIEFLYIYSKNHFFIVFYFFLYLTTVPSQSPLLTSSLILDLLVLKYSGAQSLVIFFIYLHSLALDTQSDDYQIYIPSLHFSFEHFEIIYQIVQPNHMSPLSYLEDTLDLAWLNIFFFFFQYSACIFPLMQFPSLRQSEASGVFAPIPRV